MNRATETIAALMIVQWLVFSARYLFISERRRTEMPLLVSTVMTTLVWLWFAAGLPAGGDVSAGPAVETSACASIRVGMTAVALRSVMGEPSETVSESDARGPGAEAWKYDDARCIAHVLYDRVRAVDFD